MTDNDYEIESYLREEKTGEENIEDLIEWVPCDACGGVGCVSCDNRGGFYATDRGIP